MKSVGQAPTINSSSSCSETSLKRKDDNFAIRALEIMSRVSEGDLSSDGFLDFVDNFTNQFEAK